MLNNIAAVLNSGAAPDLGAYNFIEGYTLSSGQSSITFGSGGTLPQTYKHLQLRMLAKPTAGGYQYISLRCNGDTASNYSVHYLYGEGSSTALAGGAASTARAYGGVLDAGYSGSITDILDYTSTSKNKTIRSISGIDMNGSGHIYELSGAWYNSANAITSLTIATTSGNNFDIYSSFALYGIKG